MATVAYQTKKRRTLCDCLVLPITCLHLPLQLGVFVWCHVARFTHSGRVCSGDYLSEEQFDVVRDYEIDSVLPQSATELMQPETSKRYLIMEG